MAKDLLGFIEDKEDFGFKPDLLDMKPEINPFENILEEEKTNKEVSLRAQFLEQEKAKSDDLNPQTWPPGRLTGHFKKNPAKTPQEEAERQVLLEGKKQEARGLKRNIFLEKVSSLPGISHLLDFAGKIMPVKDWEKLRDEQIESLRKLPGLIFGATSLPGIEDPELTAQKERILKESLPAVGEQVLKTMARIPEGARGIAGGILDKKPAEGLFIAGLRGFFKPEEVNSIVSRIPFQEGEQGAWYKLIPRATAEAIETFLVYNLAYGDPLGRIRDSYKQFKEAGAMAEFDRMTTNMAREIVKDPAKYKLDFPAEFNELDRVGLTKTYLQNRLGALPRVGDAFMERQKIINRLKRTLSEERGSAGFPAPKPEPASPLPIKGQGAEKGQIPGLLSVAVPIDKEREKLIYDLKDNKAAEIDPKELEKYPDLKELVNKAWAVYEKAKVVQPQVEAMVLQIKDILGLKTAQHANQKKVSSIVSKSLRKDKQPDGISDAARGAIVLDDINAQNPDTKRLLEQEEYKPIPDYGKETWGGYIPIHYTKTFPNGIKAEIQVHSPESWAYKTTVSDDFYRDHRALLSKRQEGKAAPDELKLLDKIDKISREGWSKVYADWDLPSIAATSAGESLTASKSPSILTGEGLPAPEGTQAPSLKTISGLPSEKGEVSTILPSGNLYTERSIEIPPKETLPQGGEPVKEILADEESILGKYDEIPPEERAGLDLELDALNKTPEGNLFVAIRKLGKIRGLEGNKDIPDSLKDKDAVHALDGIVAELKTYGWQFADSGELKEAIKHQAANPIEKVSRQALRDIIRAAEKNKKLQQALADKFKKRRKLITTARESPKVPEEVKKKIESLYDVLPNQKVFDEAKIWIEAHPQEALDLMETGQETPANTLSNAISMLMIDKAQAEGRFNDAIRWWEKLAEKQTPHGQTIQILAAYNRLSPEGIVKYAGKVVKEAGLPRLPEEKAKELYEAAKKLREWTAKFDAENWPDFLNAPPGHAYQFFLDLFKTLGETPDMPPAIKDSLQFIFEELKKPGLGEFPRMTAPVRDAWQFIFGEFKKAGLSETPDMPWTKGTQDKFLQGIGKLERALQREKILRTAKLLKKVQNLVPPSLGKKAAMIQTISQLLNPKTFIRNMLGNIGFMAAENISDLFGVMLDIGASVITKERTLYPPNIPEQAKGLVQGLKEGTEEALLGIDLKKAGGKFSLPENGVFDSGVLGALEKTLRVLLSAIDRGFYQAAFNQSIRNQVLSAGVEESTAEMIEKAGYEGLYRTFQDDNVISRAFVKTKKLLNFEKDFGLGDIILKYPKTPANILGRGIEYSPFGFIKSLMLLSKPLFGKPFNQAEFVKSTSRGFTGSALLVGTGALLAGLGIISGRRAKDKDVAATREMTGLREYQLNVSALKRYVASGLDPEQAKLREGDTLITYDWMLPASIGLALGANMVLAEKENLVDKVFNLGERVLQASETLAEQPLVQGLKSLTSRENILEGVGEAVKNIPASFVPTLLNQIRQLSDNTARNTKDPNYKKELYNRAVMRVPWAAGTLPPKITPLGKEKKMYQLDSNNPFNVFLNPAFVNKYKPDEVSKMVLEIWETTGETIHFPRVAQARIKLGPATQEPVELSAAQYTEYQKYIGARTDILFTILSENERFMALPDETKAKKLQGYLTDINTAAKIEVLGYRPKKVPQDVIAILKAIGENARQIKTAEEKDALGFIEE